MKPSRIFFYILTAILLVVVIFLPSFGWRLRAWLSPRPAQDTNGLAIENAALKSQLGRYATLAREVPDLPSKGNYIQAMVYSRYPTNVRSQLLINIGSREGITAGEAVIIENGDPNWSESVYVLVGRVSSVFADTALVQTVFDPDFRMAVRVVHPGLKDYDALFVGGIYPKVVSISKSATVQAHDVISTADAENPLIPYGVPIAEIAGVNVSADNLFQEASLNFPYDINAIQAVMVGK